MRVKVVLVSRKAKRECPFGVCTRTVRTHRAASRNQRNQRNPTNRMTMLTINAKIQNAERGLAMSPMYMMM